MSDDPQSWNGYAYARNSPLVYTDPFGLDYRVCSTDGKECVTYTDKAFEKFMKGGPKEGYTFKDGNVYFNGDLTATYSNSCLSCGTLINEMARRGPAVEKLTGAFAVTAVVLGATGGAGAYYGPAVIATIVGRGTTTISIGQKIEKQLGKRGWTREEVERTVSQPHRTVQTRDTRHLPGGTRMNDPATAYVNKDGSYVIRNDRTGDIVQISDKGKPGWKSPF